jgi:hypothetical protein
LGVCGGAVVIAVAAQVEKRHGQKVRALPSSGDTRLN